MDDRNPRIAEATLPPKSYAPTRETEGWRIREAADELVDVVESTAARLAAVDAVTAAAQPAPGKWSVKEIIGHLIDSASNNHQRFVRGQYGEVLVTPSYAQDFWVEAQGYADTPWPEMVEFWRLFNRHLARVMVRVPPEMLEVECRIGSYDPVALGFVIEDYVAHLKHHIHQIERLLTD